MNVIQVILELSCVQACNYDHACLAFIGRQKRALELPGKVCLTKVEIFSVA